MQGSIWLMLLYVLIGGAVGGVLKALMTDSTSLLPKSAKVNDKTGISRAGCLDNILIGTIATVVS